jgi:hypothetical protein
LYRAIAALPEGMRWMHRLPRGAWEVQWALERHEALLRSFPHLHPLLQCLKHCDGSGAFRVGHARVEQAVGRTLTADERLQAAAELRDRTRAQMFSPRIRLPERSSPFGVTRALRAVNFRDAHFMGLFALLTVTDTASSAVGLMCGAADAPAPPASAAIGGFQPLAPDRARSLGGGLVSLLPEGHADPRTWIALHVEGILKWGESELRGTLQCCQDLLLVLEPLKKQQLESLLGEPGQSSVQALTHTAERVEGQISRARSSLSQLEASVRACVGASESRTQTLAHAQRVLQARDELQCCAAEITRTLLQSRQELEQPLKTLKHAQDTHVSAELDALIHLFEDRASIEQGIEVRRLLESIQRLPALAHQALGTLVA